MDRMNWTEIEFILQGFSEYPRVEKFLFVMCLMMYLVILLGNSTLIILTLLDSRLHTPMYFFLGNLSFLDIWYTSSFIPSMLIHFLSQKKTISFTRCVVQMSVSYTMGSTECVLLAVMAYDRYMAICHPLHYSTIMTQCLCASLVAVPWVLATLNPLLHTLMLTRLHFCSNTIHHFFCDINSLFPLSCSDTSLNQSIVLAAVALIFVVPSGCIMASYSLIISAVMKIPSAQGKLKAFSTCGSHLALVILFYGAITGIYMSPSSNHSPEKDSAASAVFMVVAPGLNPFIYSLRNSELKGALKKAVGQTKTFCQ